VWDILSTVAERSVLSGWQNPATSNLSYEQLLLGVGIVVGGLDYQGHARRFLVSYSETKKYHRDAVKIFALAVMTFLLRLFG
jgi:hypothetical protein